MRKRANSGRISGGKAAAVLAVALGVACESRPVPGPSLPPNAIRQLPSSPTTPVSPTRRDLAEAYLAFDHAYDPARLTPEEERRWNLEFDRITQMFFTGQFAAAIDALRQAAAELRRPFDDQMKLGALVQVRADPEITVAPAGLASTTVRVRSFGPLKTGISIPRGLAWIQSPDLAGGDSEPEFVLPPVELKPGEPCTLDYACDLIASEKPEAHAIGLFGTVGVTTSPEPLSVWRGRVVERLDRVASRQPALAESITVTRARAEILNDTINNGVSASFRLSPGLLYGEVEAEAAALERGDDPLRWPGVDQRFKGVFTPTPLVFWRPIIRPTGNIPACVSPSPHNLLGSNQKVQREGRSHVGLMPLIIAFHGAGGDEFMFMEAYGRGAILKTSEPCVVVTPRTENFLVGTDAYDALIEQITRDYPIDRDRIYLVGHSLGGVALTNVLRTRGDQIAAAVGIAPGGGFGGPDGKPLAWIPPTRWIGAEIDPIIPASRVARTAKLAKDAGLPVESITIPNYGHTLVVGKVMKDSLDWLLEHRRTPRPDASR